MINELVLVGRIVEDPVLRVFESDIKGAFITLAVTRPFKNVNDRYDVDFIRCCIWEGMAENTCNYCKKGDVVGFKGHLNTRVVDNMYIDENGENKTRKLNTLEVIVDRVVFICTSKKYDSNKEVNKQEENRE